MCSPQKTISLQAQKCFIGDPKQGGLSACYSVQPLISCNVDMTTSFECSNKTLGIILTACFVSSLTCGVHTVTVIVQFDEM